MAQSDLVIINVLPTPVGQNCLIPGSRSIHVDNLEKHTKDFPKDAENTVYSLDYACPSGPKGYKKLDELGFANVYLYHGGIAEWFQAGELCGGPCDHEALSGEHPEQDAPAEMKTVQRHELRKKIAS